MTELTQIFLSDGGLLLFSLSGLAATAIAILRDTKTQLDQVRVPFDR